MGVHEKYNFRVKSYSSTLSDLGYGAQPQVKLVKLVNCRNTEA